MGWLDILTGTRRPPPGTPCVSAEEIRARLLGLNAPELAWRIVDGADQKVDLVCEWKVDEPRWKEKLEELGKAEWKETIKDLGGEPSDNLLLNGTSQTSRHLLKFDATKHEVRNIDRDFSVTHGRDGLTWELKASYFRGQVRTKSYSFTKGSEPDLGTEDFKVPIRQVVTEAGWVYRAIAFGKL